ncbi:MAG: hypothetical protein PF483_04315 [Halothiobacillus sp.]|jgi:hypothetical protein|nr:hypothetical protein [Halothiobacillus sp.]
MMDFLVYLFVKPVLQGTGLIADSNIKGSGGEYRMIPQWEQSSTE